ncbi:MerR family DNA-binding transcriptional regulator [Streptomyces sp. NPDC014861]|uniref:MerR family DNA-binding transcriptional regulator n=1 Tax=Streptomyces sp. NPDC014861 TaxID=3364923 RepID=UPI003700A41D
MAHLRPVDLAQEHGISPQTVRNYERDGFLPPAERTATGYRRYTDRHAAALRAYLAVVPAHGYAEGGTIMRAMTEGRLDDALAAVDRSHAELLRDRGTLDAVGEVLAHLRKRAGGSAWRAPRSTQPFSSGELAHRLGVSVATIRKWEQAGVLVPGRRPDTNHRTYDADDVRDAELAHFLRRGRYPLELIATVVRQVRTAGDTQALEAALEDWRHRVTARGTAMLRAAALLSDYLAMTDDPDDTPDKEGDDVRP